MPEKILMMALSPTMETGTLVRWRKKEGDTVASGDVLCEVETDKATMDYESTSEGTVLKIVVPAGGQAKVGDTIAILGKPGEDYSALLSDAKPAAATQAKAASQSSAVRAPASAVATAPSAAAPSAPMAATTGRIKSSPLARRIAAQRGIDLRTLRGSGPEGRIVKRDLDSAPLGAGARPAPAAGPMYKPGPGDEVIPLSNMRRVIARRLAESMFSAPHYYLTVSITMDELLATRARLNEGREKKASMNAFLMAIAGRALLHHPKVNSSWNGDSIIKHTATDIGLAVAQPDGLITPVVRDCGRKGILAIDAELADLVEKARTGKLQPAEYEGATFTISSLGSLGIDEFTAVINPPGSAILAVGAIRKEPVVGNDDTISIRQRMRVTLSCDHRVIDGAVGAAFLRELADMLENPMLALA
ncbi:MAG TPA: dihydrolipoamide acetyltransferase family protein [Spirochaetia bacterium]|nr:dihydrolipoamide acetyltransferase family protein [Spirochaetia bacterium]